MLSYDEINLVLHVQGSSKIVRSADNYGCGVVGLQDVLLVDSVLRLAVQHQQVYARPLNEKSRIFPERCFASALQFKAALFHGSQTTLQYIQRETLEHLAYSLGLPSSYYHIFPGLKEYLGGHRFQSEDDVKRAVKRYLSDNERNWY